MTPSLKVKADIIVQGVPNHYDFAPTVTKRLDQTPAQLLEGSLLAIESVTRLIEHTITHSKETSDRDLKDLVTEQCIKRLEDYFPMILNTESERNPYVILREDVFFAWIEELKGATDESISMKVCTLSFPSYGFVVRKLRENVERQKRFQDEILRSLEKEAVQKAIVDFQNSLYNPSEHINSNEIWVSNFIFTRGPENEDPWMINDISMNTGSKSFSKFGAFRMRGRMLLSLRGYKFINVLRFDYTSDYFLLLLAFLTLYVGLVSF